MSAIKRIHFYSQLLVLVALLVLLILVGTVGYILIEKYDLLEAVYMTVITIASVGYEEVRPLSHKGMVFTIFLILINLGLFTLFITFLTRYFVDGEFIRQYKLVKMQHRIQQLNQHVIICGFGRNGREAAQVLEKNKVPFVVIEEKEWEPDTGFPVHFFLRGDGTKDEVLNEAGLAKARALITTLPNDADNLYVVLTARQQNPKIVIISRASLDSSVNKLKIAGASNVIMPDKIGGAHMATLVMIPDVVELLSLMSTQNNQNFRIEEINTKSGHILGELDLWKRTGCTILGVKKGSEYMLNPPPEYFAEPGSRLIVMGTELQILHVKRMF